MLVSSMQSIEVKGGNKVPKEIMSYSGSVVRHSRYNKQSESRGLTHSHQGIYREDLNGKTKATFPDILNAIS